MKNKFIVMLAICLGLLTSYLVYDYLTKVEKAMTNVEYGEVVVVTQDVGKKTSLTQGLLQVKKVPVDYIHPFAARKLEQALGTITTESLIQGEQVLTKRITKPNEAKSGLAYIVPAGQRAITVPVDEVSGIAGLIKPGDRVDVAATVAIDDLQQKKETPHSLIVLQNIQVLAVGKTMENITDSKTPAEAKTITLAVTVEQSRPLVLASQKGMIRLMLRSPVDDSTVNTTPFKAADFLQ